MKCSSSDRGEVHLHTAISQISCTRSQVSPAAINLVPRPLLLAVSAKDCDGGSLFKLLLSNWPRMDCYIKIIHVFLIKRDDLSLEEGS